MKIATAALMAGSSLFGFAAMGAAAQPVPGETDALGDLLRQLFESFSKGQTALAGVLALILAVRLVREYVAPKVPWLRSDVGGASSLLLLAFAGSLASALVAGSALSWPLAWGALKLAVAAAGGYTLVRRLLLPLLEKIPMPAWLKSVLNAALYMFGKPGESALAAAAQAGDDAVAASPPAGTGGADDLN